MTRKQFWEADILKALPQESIFYVHGLGKRTSHGDYKVVFDKSAAVSCSLGVAPEESL
jgi:hypothetical protein